VSESTSPNVVWHLGEVHRSERWGATELGGATVWFTGLSGSGKSTVAVAVERLLLDSGRAAYRLDGDNLRHGLNGDLGFSSVDRDENVRRASEVARLFADSGLIALVPLISPYRSGRERAREIHRAADLPFLEIFVNTPIDECERRDPKGLYAKARAGEIPGFTGVDDPYEPPTACELELTPSDGDATSQAGLVVTLLRERGVLTH
jgi:bifunctional enzyme CysN/CysC